MDGSWLALVELAFSFGAVLLFYVWQMRDLNRRRADREAAERARLGSEGPAPPV